MRRIAVEEHFRIPSLKLEGGRSSPDAVKRLYDLGEGRIADMDAAGVDVEILSMSAPGPEDYGADGPKVAREANDVLYKAIKKYPKRFAGFAAIAPQYPKEAAKELERAVKEYGFVGGKINSNINGKFMDDDKYWPMWAMAEKLGVPIYLHPISPRGVLGKAFADHPKLLGANWGLAVDAGAQAMRLISSGTFDKFPGLQIFLGHMGEALPFWMWRIDNKWPRGPVDPTTKDREMKKKPSQYIKENFYATTSGVFDTPPLVCIVNEIGVDRVLFSVDYPFEQTKIATDWLDNAKIPQTVKEKVYHKNAERIFKV